MAIYILTDDHGRVKVGYSVKPFDRIEAHLKQFRRPLEVYGIFEGDRYLEGDIHSMLADHSCATGASYRGEWYMNHWRVYEILEALQRTGTLKAMF